MIGRKLLPAHQPRVLSPPTPFPAEREVNLSAAICPVPFKLTRQAWTGFESVQVHFCLPSGSILSKAELSMICAVAEIADEVLNCSGVALRMTKLVQDVTTNVEAYLTNGQVVLRSMGLLKAELKVRKKQMNNSQVSRAVSAIKDEAGVDAHNLTPLPSFSILRDSYRMHHTAQHRFADGRWNLLGQ